MMKIDQDVHLIDSRCWEFLGSICIFENLFPQDRYNHYYFSSSYTNMQPYSGSAGLKCTVARCMWKLGRETQAKELFSVARTHDPFVLTHMDLYAQILSSSKSIVMLEK